MKISKMAAEAEAERLRDVIIMVSHKIHEAPECGLKEYCASALLSKLLKDHGFHVIPGSSGMETAFVATLDSGKKGVNIAFPAEYDALPGLGHACGHNMIAAMAVGAGLALAPLMGQLGGSLYVMGTPAEESVGGKISMLDAGDFDGIDFVLMAHPTSGPTMIKRSSRACTALRVTFTGKSAHSSDPSKGINALSAVISTFQNIDLLRPSFAPYDNVNGVITSGGGPSNVIPESASCEFCLRAKTLSELKRLTQTVERCAKAAELLTGSKADIETDSLFSERYPNGPMGEAFKKNMESLGESVEYPDPNGIYGSSDISNISLRIPTIHEYISISQENITPHTSEFAIAAAAAEADEACVRGAKALAMTAFDLLTDDALRTASMGDFIKNVPERYRTI